MFVRLYFLVAIFISLSCQASQSQHSNIFAYYKQWSVYQPDYQIHDINFERITHLVYQNAKIDNKFNVVIGNEHTDSQYDNPSDLRIFKGNFGALYEEKQAHPNVQMIISIGGKEGGYYYSDLASSPKSRNHFALSALSFIRTYHFDGIEIDWPAPINGASRPEDSKNINLLLAELYEVFYIASKKYNKKYIVMITPPIDMKFQADWNINESQQYLDYFSIPTHNLHGHWESKSDHIAPLSASTLIMQQSIPQRASVDTLLLYYDQQHIDSNKIVLNISSFATAWNGVKNINNGLHQRAIKPSWGSWDSINSGRTGIYSRNDLKSFTSATGYNEFWDDTAKMHWLYNANKYQGHFISFEDKDSIFFKMEYLKKHHYSGIALRELHNDLKGDESLLNIIYTLRYPLGALSQEFNYFYLSNKQQVIAILLAIIILCTIFIYWRYTQRVEEQEDANDKARYIKVQSQLQHLEKPFQGIHSLSTQIDHKQLPLVFENEEKLGDIKLKSEQLNQFVHQLLHETTLADDSMILKPECLAPLDIFRNAMKIVFPELKEKNITISLDISQSLKEVDIDKSYLQQFFVLLLSYLGQCNSKHAILNIKTIHTETLSGFEIKEKKHNYCETESQQKALLAINRYATMLSIAISYKSTEFHGVYFLNLNNASEQLKRPKARSLNPIGVHCNEASFLKAITNKTKSNQNTQQREHSRLINLQNFSLQAETLTDIKQLIEAVFTLFVNDNQDINITVYEGQRVLHQHAPTQQEDLPEVLELSPTFLGQYRFELRTKEPLVEEDVSYFQSLITQVQLMRKQINELAKEPLLLSELYEIASQKDHINYIQADNGYSGIVFDNKDTIYLSLRLKNIKLYFKDENLLQIHRSYLVNPRKVLRVVQLSKIKYEIELENQRLPIARTYVSLIKKAFPHWFKE